MANKREAARLLRDDDSCAYTCMRAANVILGDQWMVWEPETIWLTLSRENIAVPVGNRAQLMAARGLLVHGRFWYDAVVFEKTCVAFNNEEPIIGGMSEAPIHYMAWAVYEGQTINKFYEGEELPFDYECDRYVAVRLQEEGYVLAPEQLRWAQTELDARLPKDASKLKTIVREAWALSPKGEKLLEERIPETPAGVQIAKLGAVDHYVQKRKDRMQLDIVSLEK